MEQASSAFSTGVPALAAIPQLAGNSRQGFGLVDGTMRWASGWVISSNTLGLSTSLYDSDAGSRSTGKERDSESGNDYFEARYYSSAMGRFMSPDWSAKQDPVPYARLDNPQSLNLYAYLRNNPLGGVDADGHCITGEPCSEPQYIRADGQQQTTPAPAQQQVGQDPTLPTEVQEPISPLDKALGPTPQNMFTVVTGDLGGLAEAGMALVRATELASAMGKTADFVTIAVTETKEGTTVVSSSEKALRPAVSALLKDGEVAAKGAGHAEVTGVNAAKQMGLTPTGVAASRGICPSCADFLRTAGVAALSALKGILP